MQYLKFCIFLSFLTSLIIIRAEETIQEVTSEAESVKTEVQEIPGAQSDTPEEQIVAEAQIEPSSNSVKDFGYVDLLTYYFKTNDHNNKDEILWSILDPDYAITKNNDFEYQKQKDKKLKEMQEIIKNATDKDFTLNTAVKLGPYDFKKEAFTLQDVTHTTFSLMSFETTLMKGDKVFSISQYGLDLEKSQIGNMANIKFTGFTKIKEIKVKKEIAEKVTARFGVARKVFCTMNFNNLKIKNKKTMIGKKAYYSLNGIIEYKSGICYFDDERKELAFEL